VCELAAVESRPLECTDRRSNPTLRRGHRADGASTKPETAFVTPMASQEMLLRLALED